MADLQVYAAMQTDKPKKTYIKSQLGKVVVKALNPFNDEPMEIILFGNPRKYEDSCIIDLWTDKQIVYFERMNANLINSGWIHEIDRDTIAALKAKGEFAHYTKKDKLELFERSYMGFRHFINNVADIEFLEELLELGKENEAPQSYLKVITSRIETLALARTPMEVETEAEYKEPKKKTKKKKGE